MATDVRTIRFGAACPASIQHICPADIVGRWKAFWLVVVALGISLTWAASRISAQEQASEVVATVTSSLPTDQTNEEFFERHVRPIFAEHCYSCHSGLKQSGGLKLDSREALLTGGDSGPSIVAGKAAESLLLEAIQHTGSIQMPPDSKLTDRQIEVIQAWIDAGAAWPTSTKPSSNEARQAAWKNHWAFQPVTNPTLPSTANAAWCQTPIDAFILSKLESRGLPPSSQADRRTLIRRATFSLWGMPPSPQQIEQFVNDPDPQAYEHLIDRLLDSPRYGEHWARHWLDVARYSDTKGYVYGREERFFVQAPAYRDWVVRTFNADLPYDQFLFQQIAGDQASNASGEDAVAAQGFLTIGRRFLGVTHDIIDDRIDVVTRGTMGLTASCARCHDHKYDPIPTADYYSLYGVFQNCREEQVMFEDRLDKSSPEVQNFLTELEKRRQALQTKLEASCQEASARVRQRIADYLMTQTELNKYPEEGFDVILATTDIIPAFVRRIERYLASAALRQDTVFAPWRRFAQAAKDAPQNIDWATIAKEIAESPSSVVHPAIAKAFATPPTSLRDVAERYQSVFQAIDASWQEQLKQAGDSGKSISAMSVPDDEALRQVLYADWSPFGIPVEPIVNNETYFDSGTTTELWRLQGEVDRWILQSNYIQHFAVGIFDRPHLSDARVFKRGNPANKGPHVTRHFLTALAKDKTADFQVGSGRRELAEAIIAPDNPLTARVWVNRIWMHQFGAGLVRTPSDFGLRADRPSHPELLDFLATQLIQNGWSTKSIQRMIMLSAVYQQSSTGPASITERQRIEAIDPQNELLWRMNPRKLSFEEMRDAALATTGDLDLTMGGKSSEMFTSANDNPRRTLYGLIDRQFLPPTLRMFDFANPDLHIPVRTQTMIPQQALFALNHPFMAKRAKQVTDRLPTNNASADAATDASQIVQLLFQTILQRNPSESEQADAIQFLSANAAEHEPPAPPETRDWQYGYGEADAEGKRMKSFTPLPHFTGSAWQGGPAFPDGPLGWVQLTAQGGHPGNDLQHAIIRRWTAPRNMTIQIESVAKHEPDVSDGVRCQIISSRHGVLASAQIRHSEAAMNVAALEVQAGDTIDFVVDILLELNSDQHLWSPKIIEVIAKPNVASVSSATIAVPSDPRLEPQRWDASRDFVGPPVMLLNPIEQLAQVLMLSNEWMFVD